MRGRWRPNRRCHSWVDAIEGPIYHQLLNTSWSEGWMGSGPAIELLVMLRSPTFLKIVGGGAGDDCLWLLRIACGVRAVGYVAAIES